LNVLACAVDSFHVLALTLSQKKWRLFFQLLFTPTFMVPDLLTNLVIQPYCQRKVLA